MNVADDYKCGRNQNDLAAGVLKHATLDDKEFPDQANFTFLQQTKIADYVLGWALYRSNGSKLTASPNQTDAWSVQLSA